MALDVQPSRTALLSAAARAAHLIVDAEPLLFADTLAGRLLGAAGTEMIRYHQQQGDQPILANARVYATVRSSFAESALRRAVGRGIEQYMMVGAGLDTFGGRSELARRLLVVEIDHPATQRWKRDRLAASGVDSSNTVRYVELDLLTDSLFDRAVAAGLDPSRPTFVSWLGGTPYFTRSDLGRVFADMARLAPGSELVADYHLPPEARDIRAERYVNAVSAVAAAGAEPWKSTFIPDEMAALLKASGFTVAADRGERAAVPAALWGRRDGLAPGRLLRLVHARRGVERENAAGPCR